MPESCQEMLVATCPPSHAARFSGQPAPAKPSLALGASARMISIPRMPSGPLKIGSQFSSNSIIPACAAMCSQV